MTLFLDWVNQGFDGAVGWALIVGGCVALVWVACKSWQGIRSKFWPHVVGTITNVTVERKEGQNQTGSTKYTPRVFYRYQVDGVEYVNSKGGYRIVESSGAKSFAETEVARYAGRDQVQVYYNSKKPSQSVLETGVGLSICLVIPFAIALIVVGIILL